MCKEEQLVKAYIAIDEALGMSYATLETLNQTVDDKRVIWVIRSVMEQIEKIREAEEIIDQT